MFGDFADLLLPRLLLCFFCFFWAWRRGGGGISGGMPIPVPGETLEEGEAGSLIAFGASFGFGAGGGLFRVRRIAFGTLLAF